MSQNDHTPSKRPAQAPNDNPQQVNKAIERNRQEFENGAQVPGGSYDIDPAYAAAAAKGADDSFGGDLDEQPDQPTKSP